MAASGGSIFDSLVTNANNNIAQSRKQKHAYEASITAFQSDMAADEKQLKLVCERDELTSKVSTSAVSPRPPNDFFAQSLIPRPVPAARNGSGRACTRISRGAARERRG